MYKNIPGYIVERGRSHHHREHRIPPGEGPQILTPSITPTPATRLKALTSGPAGAGGACV